MDASAVLRSMRRLIGEVAYTIGDDVSPTYTDVFLMEYVQEAADYLEISNIGDTPYEVTTDPASISPEPSKIDGMLLATLATSDLLSGDLAKKVRDGDLGMRFRTGLNEISTVEASRRVVDQARDVKRRFDKLVTLKLANNPLGVERVQ